MQPAIQERCTGAIGHYQRGKRKEATVASTHHHDLLDELARLLQTSGGDLRSTSIQDLDLVCRARGSSLVLLVRDAESTIQRFEQDRDGHIQRLGDDDQVLDGPTGAPP
jgi:hypothetical protein